MHTLLALFMMTLPIAAPRSTPRPPCVEHELTVTAQVHDYWHLSGESLATASEIVSRLYDRIGVTIEWYPALKKDLRHPGAVAGRAPSGARIAQMTVIVLTPEMAIRAHFQEGVLGLAAVPEDGMGRIAYVVYDRVQRAAAGSGADEVRLMGSVMAHEISHLLLGRGSHADAGLMKDRLNHFEVRQLAEMKLEFSEPQADQIRRTIENDSRTTAAMAHERTLSSVDACVAALPH
jgi:hypothetical protein